jgi:kanamycin kinase
MDNGRMARFISGPPEAEAQGVEVPRAVRDAVLPGDEVKAVWRNARGGVTFRLQPARVNPCSSEYVHTGGIRYAKWSPMEATTGVPHREIDLSAEVERLRWAGRWATVPQVLEFETVAPTPDDAGGQLLVTAAIHGRSAVSPYWRARPAEAARVIGAGLRAFHDALPVNQCPFDWSVAERVEGAGLRGTPQGEVLIAEAPDVDADNLVVCHGDACAPNVLLDAFGSLAGYVDLGRLGLADRWADLAIAAWSTEWNYGPGFEQAVYAGYGIKPDVEKIAFYRHLWDAS